LGPPTYGVYGFLLLNGMDYIYLEHEDAQKGPPFCSFGESMNVHPKFENMSSAASYGKLSLHAQRSWLNLVA